MNTKPEQMAILGYIAGVFGVKGWVKVLSYTQPVDNILNYKQWYLQSDKQQQDHWQATELIAGQSHGKGLIAQIAGITDRDAAAQLVKTKIAVPRSELPEPGTDEYYWHDLIGLDVINLTGESLGKIKELFATGANDVMVVKAGKHEHLIPYVWEHVIKHVDLMAGVVKVDWEAGYSEGEADIETGEVGE